MTLQEAVQTLLRARLRQREDFVYFQSLGYVSVPIKLFPSSHTDALVTYILFMNYLAFESKCMTNVYV